MGFLRHELTFKRSAGGLVVERGVCITGSYICTVEGSVHVILLFSGKTFGAGGWFCDGLVCLDF